MITTIKLINISITSQLRVCVCVCVCVVGILYYSLSKFQVHNTVLLTTVTMLYIKSPEYIHLIIESVYFSPFSPPPSPTLYHSDLLTEQLHLAQLNIMEYFAIIRKNEVVVVKH